MLRQVIEIHELLDDAAIDGQQVVEYLQTHGAALTSCETIGDAGASTDFLKIVVPGSDGRHTGGSSPTLGIIGRLGGVGARPHRTGLVSDADGAIVALACALKLTTMASRGDSTPGDIIIATHICPGAPIIPHHPVAFMDSPVDMETMNRHEVDADMDGILVIDATKGNRVINHAGFAVTPTIKEGFILRTPDRLIDTMEWVTAEPAKVMPVTSQDITPYGNGLDHVNSLLQPATATNAPVVGVAITSQAVVPGSSTGANREVDLESAARFCVEVAKFFGSVEAGLHDPAEFERLCELYGPMNSLQTRGAIPN